MWLERGSGDGEREAHWKRQSLNVASWQNHGTATWPLGGHIVSDGPHVFHKGFHMLFNQPIDLSLILWNICTEIYLYLTGLIAHVESINSINPVDVCLVVTKDRQHCISRAIDHPPKFDRIQIICEPAHITKEEKDGWVCQLWALSCVHLLLSCFACATLVPKCTQPHPTRRVGQLDTTSFSDRYSAARHGRALMQESWKDPASASGSPSRSILCPSRVLLPVQERESYLGWYLWEFVVTFLSFVTAALSAGFATA